MPEDFPFMPYIRLRYPRWMKCHTCHKPLHDHTEEQFRECHGPRRRVHVYSWDEYPDKRPNPDKTQSGAGEEEED